MAREVAVVIGGTGFVGRQVCETLGRAGLDVVSMSRGTPGSAPPGRHVLMDITAGPTTAAAAVLASYRPRIVVNATGGIWGLSDEQMRSAITTPTERLVKVLELLPQRPRLVHLGSVLEYGPLPWGASIGRDTVPRARTPYARAKLAATEVVRVAAARGRLDAVVLRLANVAGPGSPPRSLLGVVAEQLSRARSEGVEPVVHLGRLTAHRDYVDVRDVAEAVRAAASVSSGAASLEAIPVGSGEAVPVRTLVRLLIERSGIDARVVERAAPVRAGGVAAEEWAQVDTGVAWDLLRWRPRRRIEESVDAYWSEGFASLTTT
ncbi:NAD-dependent epimerase/dehydratase family protein [Streptomyces sp. NPDC005791]|uniref:NAD-dependent epimerase/dehydratase family protein n=1 Tax=unclassified Streptomyces TaxID=2593676 RepID=UPI0033F6334C